MSKYFSLLFFLLVFSLNLFSDNTKTYKINKTNSFVNFTSKTSLFKVKGEFEEFDLQVLDKNKIILKIKTASINTKNKKRDAHLKDKDFFDIKKYPEIFFKSHKIEKIKNKNPKNNSNYHVFGKLKIKNRVQEIKFPVEIYRKNINKKTIYTVSGRLELDRKKYGIDYESSFPMPSIKDQVGVNFELTLDYAPNPK